MKDGSLKMLGCLYLHHLTIIAIESAVYNLEKTPFVSYLNLHRRQKSLFVGSSQEVNLFTTIRYSCLKFCATFPVISHMSLSANV